MLLRLYLSVLALAVLATALSALPAGWKLLVLALCAVHAWWTLPRYVLLSDAAAWRGLRHDETGWQLWSRAHGWQPVQLRPDSLALPLAVVLRVRLPGAWRSRGLCIPFDAMGPAEHRRLRVRLKFSRRRWAAPE